MPKPTLVFTGTKNFGKQLEYKLNGEFPNSTIKFISADFNLSERNKWISKFKAGEVDVLISTTILAWGVNLPARHVVIAQTAFGLQEMPACDIQQMMGRAGRPRFDDEGDAFILLDSEEYDHKHDMIENGQDILSLFSSSDVLQFHGMAEIAKPDNPIRDFLDFYRWHSRSLANLQGLSPESAEKVIEELKRYRCVEYEDGIIKPKVLGNISYWLYYKPREVYQFDLNLRKFAKYFENNDRVTSEYTQAKYRVKDVALSMAMNWMVDLESFVPKDRRGEAEDFYYLAMHSCPDFVHRGQLHGSLLDAMDMCNRISGGRGKMIPDFGRLCTAFKMVSNMSLREGRGALFDSLAIRYQYGAPEELMSLLRIKQCGKVIAGRLYRAGVKDVEAVVDPENYSVILGTLNSRKKADTLIENARNSI